jgi:hypothetical protein
MRICKIKIFLVVIYPRPPISDKREWGKGRKRGERREGRCFNVVIALSKRANVTVQKQVTKYDCQTTQNKGLCHNLTGVNDLNKFTIIIKTLKSIHDVKTVLSIDRSVTNACQRG